VLLLDGGDAPRLAPLLSLPVQMVSDSVLHGLALWADAHMPAAASH
jgi:type III pantothenate kinase